MPGRTVPAERRRCMILFIGTEQAGYFVSEVAAAQQTPIQITGLMLDLQKIQNLALQENYAYIVINVAMLADSSQDIASMIEHIRLSASGRIIILAQGYSIQSEMIQELIKVGITNFLTSNNLSEIKRQLETALKEVNDTQAQQSQTEIPAVSLQKPHPSELFHTYKTIAVAGSMARIGTTTQCIQIVKFLALQGKRACYIEMNRNGYVNLLKEFYEDGVTIDEQIGKITYQNVDMFYKKDQISEILKMNYDYYIYDYGAYQSNDFTLISFLEKNIKFVVCGTKPNEFTGMQQVLKAFYHHEINYIFSFSPESEHQDVLSLMEEKAQHTYFALSSPDLFFYSSNSDTIYNKIFYQKLEPAQENTPEKRKNFFFSKKK